MYYLPETVILYLKTQLAMHKLRKFGFIKRVDKG